MARKKSGIEKSGTDGLFDTGNKEEPTAPTQRETFTKYTFPITGALREKMDKTLRDVAFHQQCDIPKSLLIRHALDLVLTELANEKKRTAMLKALARRQESEIKVAAKYSPDKGLQRIIGIEE